VQVNMTQPQSDYLRTTWAEL